MHLSAFFAVALLATNALALPAASDDFQARCEVGEVGCDESGSIVLEARAPFSADDEITFDERDVAELKAHIMRRIIEPVLQQAEAAAQQGAERLLNVFNKNSKPATTGPAIPKFQPPPKPAPIPQGHSNPLPAINKFLGLDKLE